MSTKKGALIMVTMKTPIEICCEECGSKNVRRDAFASWDEENQQWELSEVFDNGVCQDCEDEVNLKEKELE